MNVPNLAKTDLEQILERLSLDQIRFVIARVDCVTDKEAAQKVALNYNSIRTWPREAKELIDQACRLMAQDGIVTALHLRRRSLAKAMGVKAAGLDSHDEKVKQSVATEIIEWEMGKAAQPFDLDMDYRGELARKLNSLVADSAAGSVPTQPDA